MSEHIIHGQLQDYIDYKQLIINQSKMDNYGMMRVVSSKKRRNTNKAKAKKKKYYRKMLKR